MAFQLNLRSSRQTSRDENLEAKVPGGGGRVKGGTEATTRSILELPGPRRTIALGFIALM